MNSKLFCSAVLFVLFICIVANFNNNKGLFNKVISLLLLLSVIVSILSASSDNNIENFKSLLEGKKERIELLNRDLKERKELRSRLDLANLPDADCDDKRIISMGAGYHPLKDVPACVEDQIMFNFSKSKCKPECCDFGKNNGFSCSTGCVCKE